MPGLSPTILTREIIRAVSESGLSAFPLSAERSQPRKFVILKEDGTELSVWIYIWTLTHGGRPSLPNEFRIQMTSVESPLALNPAGPTLLMGFDPDLRVFAGFDITKHQRFTSGSPSVQIDKTALRNSIQNGLAFDRKDNNELATAIRPDQFFHYVENAGDLHSSGAKPGVFRVLEKATDLTQRIPEIDINQLSQPRKKIIQTISRLSRSANFKLQVLRAYGFRCAVTRMQLRLVDAAHILPVQAPGSLDDVRNGIALSPTMHRAYDSGLIYFNPSYELNINEKRSDELSSDNLIGGLEEIKKYRGKILLPANSREWPDPRIIRKANIFRNVN